MKKASLPETTTANTSPINNKKATQLSSVDEDWFDDACVLDMDYFVKTISGIKAKGVRSDLIGSIITHYASKWLPDLSSDQPENVFIGSDLSQEESITSSWMKKRFFVETLIKIIPTESSSPPGGSVPCNFLLRLLRIANMVGGIENSHRLELEKMISCQLHQATLKEVLIPSFNHTCKTLLDVELFTRLVKKFLVLDGTGIRTSGAGALNKVSKIVDSYLAEAALDPNLTLSEFIDLADALPMHARSIDDGLYRAIDTYLKVHPGVTKSERKLLCRLIDTQKLTPEATIHASQNERLPVRAVVQVLLTEQNKLINKQQQLQWSGQLGAIRSPSPNVSSHSNGGFEQFSAPRCHSKRDINAQQVEINKLKEDVIKLQNQCNVMQGQLEKVLEKRKGGFFVKWKIPSFRNVNGVSGDHQNKSDEFGVEVGYGRYTPAMDMKTRLVKVKGKTPPRWRKSLS